MPSAYLGRIDSSYFRHRTVAFYDGATALKTASLSGGVAKFTTSKLASGTHDITATYNGTADYSGSSGSLIETVN